MLIANGLKGQALKEAGAVAKSNRVAADGLLAELRAARKERKRNGEPEPRYTSRYDKACWAGRAGA